MKTSLKPLRVDFFQRLSLVFLPGILAFSSLTGCSVETPKAESKVTGFKAKVVHMGYQSSGDIVRLKGVIEERLKPLGVSVEWAQFAAGPQLMEAMNVGKVDVGSVGETPPIFAQAAGTSLVYIASLKPSNGEGSGIIVPQDSPIRSVADLKGKKIVFQKGSASHYLLVKALAEVGLKYSDIQAVSLPPADAQAAFIQGKLDAWVTWDPYLALAQKTANARVLRNAKGIATQGGFYMGSRNFVSENPELVRLILESIDNVGKWAAANPNQVAQLVAPTLKIDVPTLEVIIKRRSYQLRPITSEILDNQQKIANLFTQEKVIPKHINIQEAALTPEQYAAITPKTISQK